MLFFSSFAFWLSALELSSQSARASKFETRDPIFPVNLGEPNQMIGGKLSVVTGQDGIHIRNNGTDGGSRLGKIRGSDKHIALLYRLKVLKERIVVNHLLQGIKLVSHIDIEKIICILKAGVPFLKGQVVVAALFRIELREDIFPSGPTGSSVPYSRHRCGRNLPLEVMYPMATVFPVLSAAESSSTSDFC